MHEGLPSLRSGFWQGLQRAAYGLAHPCLPQAAPAMRVAWRRPGLLRVRDAL